jgi:hypothetical protein
MRLATLLLILTVGFLTATPVQAQRLDPGSEELREFIGSLREVERSYPSDRYFILGLGRSPTLWIDGLRFLRPSNPGAPLHVAQLPLSGVRSAEVTPEQLTTLYQHFDRHFPSEPELRGRTVVLLDFSTQTGESAFAAQELLNRYLQARRRETPLSVALIGGPGLEAPRADRIFRLPDSNDGVLRQLFSHTYDLYSDVDSATLDQIEGFEYSPPRKPYELAARRLMLDRLRVRLVESGFSPPVAARAQQEIQADEGLILREWQRFPSLPPNKGLELLETTTYFLSTEQQLRILIEGAQRWRDEDVAKALRYLPDRVDPQQIPLYQELLRQLSIRPISVAAERRFLNTLINSRHPQIRQLVEEIARDPSTEAQQMGASARALLGPKGVRALCLPPSLSNTTKRLRSP